MPQDTRPTATLEETLIAGLAGPSQTLLLRLLLYKSVFTGSGFRSLAMREESPAVADLLLRLHAESAAEAAALALAIREWDAHPASAEKIAECAEELRRQFLLDVIGLKEGLVEVSVLAAMRAPDEGLRQRLLALADVDRRHADALREVLGAPTVLDHLGRRREKDAGGARGAGAGRVEGETLSRTIRRALSELERVGATPRGLVLGPDALRHLRDEGGIDEDAARAFDLPVEVDMGWSGDCYSIQTLERIGYAELISAKHAAGEGRHDTP